MTSKEKVLSVYPDATAYHTSDNYWTVLKTNTYPRVSIYPDGVQYTEAEAWEAAKNQLPSAPSPAGETASEEQCKHCDGPMPPLGAASMCPEHPHQPLSGMCEGSGDDTVCSGCGEDAFYDNGDVTYTCGCNRGWTLRRKFLMRKSDAVPEPVSPEGSAKVYGFEEWWAKYLAGREINPFPNKASLWNAKQAAWSSWHAAIAAPEAAAAETIALGFKPWRVLNNAPGIIGFRSADSTGNTLELFLRKSAAPIAPAAGSGLFDAWWIQHSRYGYASNEELAVAAWNAAVSSQTASAASPVAGVSGEKVREITHTLWYRGGRMRSELNDAIVMYPENWHAEGLQRMLAQWDEIANQYASQILLAQPSAEGDGWIAWDDKQPAAGEKVMFFRKGTYALGYKGETFGLGNVYWRPLPTPPSVQEESK